MKKILFAMFFAFTTASLVACEGCPEDENTEEVLPVAPQEESTKEDSAQAALLTCDSEEQEVVEEALKETMFLACKDCK